MSGVFLRWGIPGFVTVVGGTAISVMMTGENIASDLTSRASDALANARFGWASVSFNSRDAVISGTASDQQMIDAVVARVASVHGVRTVSSNVVLAEFASPFPFEARRDGAGIALSGGVPDETAHAEIVLRTAAAADGLRLLSGAPDRAAWRAAVNYGLGFLDQFDEGEVKLADLDLSISGRASSPEAYDALVDLSQAGAPQGVRIAALDILPALASPFEWRAGFDGRLVTISGYAPTEEFAQRLQAADLAGIPVSTSLVLASGAPQGFDRNAMLLLENLVRLEQGTGTISDGSISLAGAPPDGATAEAVRLAMSPAGAAVTLDPPRIAEYELTATRSGGTIALDGFVPDAATLERLDGLDNVDAAGLELARGAPQRFDSAVEFTLDALGRMSEGSAVIRGTTITLEGRATTVADFAALETIIALGAPQGLILGKTTITPPLARIAGPEPVVRDFVDQLRPLDLCRQKLDAFASRNAILFQSGSARITGESAPALDELAGYLAICPDAAVQVEGHTDADGADDLNLVLSVARAEAVVNALIARGVRSERLYAVGYGEGLPIADNETRAGKQANRRIAFTVLDAPL